MHSNSQLMFIPISTQTTKYKNKWHIRGWIVGLWRMEQLHTIVNMMRMETLSSHYKIGQHPHKLKFKEQLTMSMKQIWCLGIVNVITPPRRMLSSWWMIGQHPQKFKKLK